MRPNDLVGLGVVELGAFVRRHAGDGSEDTVVGQEGLLLELLSGKKHRWSDKGGRKRTKEGQAGTSCQERASNSGHVVMMMEEKVTTIKKSKEKKGKSLWLLQLKRATGRQQRFKRVTLTFTVKLQHDLRSTYNTWTLINTRTKKNGWETEHINEE